MITLENKIREALTKKKILLMTHLVLGYPSFEVNREVIRQMVENGVDLIEMQIPFTEPMADGPMILKEHGFISLGHPWRSITSCQACSMLPTV